MRPYFINLGLASLLLKQTSFQRLGYFYIIVPVGIYLLQNVANIVKGINKMKV